MVIILKREIQPEEKQHIIDFLESRKLKIKEIAGVEETILGAVGMVTLDPRTLEVFPGVARVIPITKAYKLASREMQKKDTIVNVGGVRFGGNTIAIIAGPCAVESRSQILEAACAVKEAGAVVLRGGAYKPRTSPYAFQGLREEGLKYLKEAGESQGLPVVTEIVSTETAELMLDYVDIFQIGARNMQNFELLKKVGSLGRPVILKRGLAATIDEWLMAAEYLMAHGTQDVILCERGIRTFETQTRNTLDLSAIPVVKKLSHLPVIVDPSHGTGLRDKVHPMALAAVAAGADGLIVEVHPEPEKALSDGPQSLYPVQFEKLVRDVEAFCPVIGKDLEILPVRPKAAPAVSGSSPQGSPVISAAFQGHPGAFSEQALQRFFRDQEFEARACPLFRDVFRAVASGKSRFGIIPIENTLTGSIHENYDLIIQHQEIRIVGEKIIRVEHSLLGFEGTAPEGLTKIFSHPQGLAQCAVFLDRYPAIERAPWGDTAGACAFVAQEGRRDWAAIANSIAGEYYGLSVLKQNIETNPNNYTRFFIIAQKDDPYTGPEGSVKNRKASFIFSLKDEPGQLEQCLGILAKEKINLQKIESRPIIGKPWEYLFYMDAALPAGRDEGLGREVLSRLEKHTLTFRNCGIYVSG
ncbi:MAG: 3-deoxy-7-phosphoheptulonate synthase [Spirochaetales bacterium]|jgi:3-deoxy-7-phosphoheptulonate synthase|nr:3-deoxy-7-phosphoheptulonate synthase [Spirochaetales bacterium]